MNSGLDVTDIGVSLDTYDLQDCAWGAAPMYSPNAYYFCTSMGLPIGVKVPLISPVKYVSVLPWLLAAPTVSRSRCPSAAGY